MDELFHHPFTCVVAGPTTCGKIYPACEKMMTPTPSGSVVLSPLVTDWKERIDHNKCAAGATISALEIHHRR